MFLRMIFAALLVMVVTDGFAQKSEIDSLQSLVASVPSDTTKVWLLNRLVSSLREKDNNKALKFAEEAASLAELLAYKKGLSIALENLGWILYRKGDYSRSLDVSTRALRVSESVEDRAAIARCLINIAAIHYEQKQYQQAIENFRKAARVATIINDKKIIARCYNNIAYAFLGMKTLDSAYINVRKGIAFSEASDDVYMKAFALRTLGDIHLQKGNSSEALSNFYNCFDLSEKLDNSFLKSSVLHRLGKTYFLLGNYDKTLSYLEDAITIANQFGFKDELERSYKLMAETYFKRNDLLKAYKFQQDYVNLHDSLYAQRNSEQLALMQIRFDTEMKQAQIELLTKEAALRAQEIERKNVWIYFYVGCLSLLLILAFVLFYNNQYNSKAKQALQEKNAEIQTQTHQLRNLNSTKDKLFSIISHDLRSPVASLRALMEILGSSGLTQDEFVDVTRALKRNLDSVYDDLDNLLLWAQTQLKGLQAYPEEVDLRALAEEKIDLFNDLARNKKILMVNAIPPDVFVWADKNHLNLVLRNLLTNAIKFNQIGGRITLSAEKGNDFYAISVSDSGVGMEAADLRKLFNAETHFTKPGTYKEKGVGIGLLLTKEFVEINEGTIYVRSELGKGTTFTFTLKTCKTAVLV